MSTNTYEQPGKPDRHSGHAGRDVHATDERDWDAVAAAFADRVAPDYASLSGGGPAVLSGRQIAEAQPTLMTAVQVNFLGAWRTTRAFVPGMRDRGWGPVVNISTGYAHLASEPPTAGAYGLAKAALNALTRTTATEAGPRIKVNCMSPGWVATRMGGTGAPTFVAEGDVFPPMRPAMYHMPPGKPTTTRR